MVQLMPRIVETRPDCECGDRMLWQPRGWFRPGWRLECICGRCGPWRNSPDTERLPLIPPRPEGVPLPARPPR